MQVGNLIGGLSRVQHLIKGDTVNTDDGVVAGDNFLCRNVKHLLHHIKPCADPVEEWNDQIEARHKSAGVTAKALHGVVITLRHSLDPGK
ncbi:hypothetical protein FQZ97_1064250 [compost metagenome]